MIDQRAAEQRAKEKSQKRMIDKAIKHYRKVNKTAVMACSNEAENIQVVSANSIGEQRQSNWGNDYSLAKRY